MNVNISYNFVKRAILLTGLLTGYAAYYFNIPWLYGVTALCGWDYYVRKMGEVAAHGALIAITHYDQEEPITEEEMEAEDAFQEALLSSEKRVLNSKLFADRLFEFGE